MLTLKHAMRLLLVALVASSMPSQAMGKAGYIFDSLSLYEDVVLFASVLPLGPGRIHTLLTSGSLCDRGAKIPKKQKFIEDDRRAFYCVFDGRVRTPVRHVTVQAVRCDHPPEEERASLIGKPVTMEVNRFQSISVAVYRPIPPAEQTPLLAAPMPDGSKPKKRYKLCSCLQIWNRAEFLQEWLIYFTNLVGVEKLFVYDNLSSEIDQLKDVVDWLSLGYEVDWYNWPKQKTQTAFNSHCTLRARRECEWVTL